MFLHLLSSKTIYFFLYICLFMLFHNPIRAQVLYQGCQSSQGDYTNGSRYETNLNLLLQSLNNETPSKGYYNTSTGIDPDQVYGLAQCWHGVSSDSCRKCLNTSMVDIIRICRNSKEAFIRNDECLLRYSNQRFFTQPDLVPGPPEYNPSSSENPNLFNQKVGELMNNLSSRNLSPSMYATSSVRSYDFPIYGSVECVLDISSKDCQSCLKSMIDFIPDCCSGKLGARIISLSCSIRYELYSFGETPPPPAPVAAPPPPVVAPPPPPPPVFAPPPLPPPDEYLDATKTVDRITLFYYYFPSIPYLHFTQKLY